MKSSGTLLLALMATPTTLLAQEGGGLFDVNPGLSIWTIVVFFAVLFILGKFAWGPILGVVEAREDGIRDSIQEAKTMKQEAEALLQETRDELAAARRQAQDLVAEGRSAGDRVRREVETKAREEADRILERARLEIERERDKALETVRVEAVELALAAASRVLDERLDAEADRELVQRYLQDISRSPAEA
ncbi:MAG: F0F1 ATP synthase subunit B [Gemmatimonadota bacterium]